MLTQKKELFYSLTHFTHFIKFSPFLLFTVVDNKYIIQILTNRTFIDRLNNYLST